MNKLFLCAMMIFSLKGFSQSVSKFRIDPDKAYGGTVSEYFDSVEYIPLETTKESLFGDISQMLVTDSSYVVYDQDTKGVLFFTLTGKYITKVTEKENTWTTLSIDRSIKKIVALTYDYSTQKSSVEYYYFTGNLYNAINPAYKQLPFDKERIISIGDNFYAKANELSFATGKENQTKPNSLLTIYKDTSVYKYLMPYNTRKKTAFCALARQLTLPYEVPGNSFYVSTPFSYNVYKLTKDTAVNVFQFVFPQDRSFSTLILDSENSSYIDSMRTVIEHDIHKIKDVSNIFYYKHSLFFKINQSSYVLTGNEDSRYQYNFILDTASGRLSSFERITPDKSNYYLPIMGNGIMPSMFGLEFKGENFYSFVSSLQMFAAMEATKDKYPSYPPALQAYFKTQNRKANPVIVKMKLKE